MSTSSLWHAHGDSPPVEIELAEGALLSAGGVQATPPPPDSASPPDSVAIVPAASGDAPAVALIPDGTTLELRRNGTRLRPGIHVLHHADRLDFGGRTLWLSSEQRPVETTYDPDVHGKDVRCYRTKVRLMPGVPIVICPGIPSVRCRSIYKKAAWDMGLRCHHCGFDPSRPRWRPPAPKKERALDDLLRILSGK